MDIVAILKECIETSKKNVLIFVPMIIVGIISFLLEIVLRRAVIMAANLGWPLPDLIVGAMVTLVVVTTTLFGVLACAVTIGMAQETLTRGIASLNTGLDMAKQTLIPVILSSVIVGIIGGLGFMLLILPGLLAMFFLLFTLPAVVLDNFGAVDAIKKSVEIVKNNVSDAFVLFFALLVICIIFAIVNYFLNFIPILGKLIGAFLGGIVSGYITIVIVRCYRIFVPAS
jgi:hypothetical protein